MKFNLKSDYKPSGDQPKAIIELTEGLKRGDKFQTLLGVTGSGKTFTISHVIQNIGKPTLVMSHNKTLAAQLYGELKGSFLKTKLNFSSAIMIIINPSLISLLPILILQKIFR